MGVMTWGDATGLSRFHPAKMAYGGADGFDEEKRALETGLAAGVNLYDTAAMYSGGASERRLGEVSRGTSALIATKFPGNLRARAEDMPAELDASLKRLGRPSVDLYQHHFPSNRVDIPRLMNLMADAVVAGKVRAVGVSNYSAEQMRLAQRVLADRGVALASNQVEYSLLHRRPEVDGVLDACRELGVTLIAYTPLAGGALTGKYAAGDRPKGLRRFMMKQFRRGGLESVTPIVALLQEIGAAHGAQPAQVALRWLVENECVLPIPGAKNSRQAADNAGALSFRLSPSEAEALDRATTDWQS
jgi:aryl-alcohol dehydrogenase-like predicted oxidoreductase